MKKSLLSQAEINQLLRTNTNQTERTATVEDRRIIREGLLKLKVEHERRSNPELAQRVERLINCLDFIDFQVRENEDQTKLLVSFSDPKNNDAGVMFIPIKK